MNALSSGASAIAIGCSAVASGKESVAMGLKSKATADFTTAVGADSQATIWGATALGNASKATGYGAVAVGYNTIANAEDAVAVGEGARAMGLYGIAIGGYNEALGQNSIAFGYGASARLNNALAIGANSVASHTNAVALGVGSTTSAAVSTTGTTLLGQNYTFAGGTADSVISVGNAGTKRQITNVAAGQIGLASTDAVNGSQLFATNQALGRLSDDALQWDAQKGAFSASHGAATTNKIMNLTNGDVNSTSKDAVNGSQLDTLYTKMAATFGGGTLTVSGAWFAPTYTIQGSSYNNVGDALGAVNTNLTTLYNNIGDGTVGPVQRLGATSLTLIAAGGDATTPGVAQVLTNVGNGAVSAASTDAVNGSQLHAAGTGAATIFGGGAAYVNGAWTNPTYTVQSGTYNDVGSALGAVDSNLTSIKGDITTITGDITTINGDISSINTNITNIADGKLGPVQRSATGVLSLIAAGGDATTPGVAQVLTNVGNGAVSAASTDAINGSQLHAAGTGTAAIFGGGAAYMNGTWTNPTYTVQSGTYNDVGSALGAVDTNLTSVKGDITTITGDISTINTSLTTINGDITTINGDISSINTNITNIADGKLGPVQRSATGVLSLIAAGGDATTPGAAQVLTNVANGTVSAASTDAINGSQLHAAGTGAATIFGGGAAYVNGTWTNPTYTVQSGTYNDVGSALGAVDSNLTTLYNNIGSGSVGPVQRIDGTTLTLIASGGNAAAPGVAQVLGNVANGAVAMNSLEAVNGSQLHAAGTGAATIFGGGAAYVNGTWTNPTYTVQSGTYNDVGSALGAVDGNLTTIKTDIANINTNVTNGTVGPVQRSATGVLSLIADGGSAATPGVAQVLTNVANGAVSAASTDAVNGSQLHAAGTGTATIFGGGATYVNGAWTNPTYTVQSGTYNDVGSALGAVDGSLTNITGDIANITGDITMITGDISSINTSITNIADGKLGPVQRSATGVLSLIAAGGDATTPGAAQVLTNVANGAVSAASTDAVNGSQLHAAGTGAATIFGGGAAYVNGAWTNPTYTVQSGTYNDVGSALGAVDSNLTSIKGDITTITGDITTINGDISSINTSITNIADGKLGPVQRSATGVLSLIAAGGDATTPGVAQVLTNVGNGAVSAASTDAINGSQLHSAGTGTATIFGGGAAYVNGAWTNPTYTVQSGTYNDVGSALGAVDTNLTSVKGDITTITGDISTINTSLTTITGDITTINGDISSINTNITNIADGKLGPVQRSATGVLSLIAAGGDATTPGASQVLTNVANGAVSAASTDAINGSQLFGLGTSTASALGGNASFIGGAWMGPTYNLASVDANGNVTSATYTDVGSALGGLDTNINNVNTRVTTIDGKIEELGNDALLWDTALNAYSASHGTNGTSKITNVTAGLIAQDSTDAVNGGQVHAMNQQVASIFGGGAAFSGGSWSNPTYNITNIGVNGAATTTAYNNVGDALTGMNGSINNVNDRITNLETNVGGASGGGHIERTGDNELSLVADGGSAANPGDSQKLTNVAGGTVAAGSTDAVNGGQLHEVNQNVNTVGDGAASALGGGAGYDSATGTWTGPEYNVAGVASNGTSTNNTYNNVGDALTGLGNSINNVNNQISGIGGDIEDLKNDALLWDADKGAYSASHGGTDSKITNVAKGEVSATSTDAVNGSQLYAAQQNTVQYDLDENGNKTNTVTLQGGDPNAPVVLSNVGTGVKDTDAVNVAQLKQSTVNYTAYIDQRSQQTLQQANSYTDARSQQTLEQANSYTDQKFGQLNKEIGSVRKEARQAAAVGLAAASLRYDDRPGKLSVAAGGGAWRGQGALSMGVGYTSKDGNIRANLAATSAGGKWGVGAGLSFTLN